MLSNENFSKNVRWAKYFRKFEYWNVYAPLSEIIFHKSLLYHFRKEKVHFLHRYFLNISLVIRKKSISVLRVASLKRGKWLLDWISLEQELCFSVDQNSPISVDQNWKSFNLKLQTKNFRSSVKIWPKK
jgi:hypothetical protein